MDPRDGEVDEEHLFFVEAASPYPTIPRWGRVLVGVVGLLLLIAGGVFVVLRGDSTDESVVTPAASEPQPIPFTPWDGDEVLVVGYEGTRVLIVDLSTGESRERHAPEPLVPAEPAALDGIVVFVGENRAWSTDVETVFHVWRNLGAADAVRPSTVPNRVWLRTSFERDSIFDPAVRWEDVDLSGEVHRAFERTLPILLMPPEVVYAVERDFAVAAGDRLRLQRLLQAYSAPVAVGPNDVIHNRCDDDGACERVWLDVATAEELGPPHDELARSIDVFSGGRLSPDGRFLVHDDDAGGLSISSIATGVELPNDCLSDAQVTWTEASELVACSTVDGVAVYSTERGGSIGLRLPTDPHVAFAFVPKR